MHYISLYHVKKRGQSNHTRYLTQPWRHVVPRANAHRKTHQRRSIKHTRSVEERESYDVMSMADLLRLTRHSFHLQVVLPAVGHDRHGAHRGRPWEP